MFEFIKKLFVVTMAFFSCTALNAIQLKCVSMNDQECIVRREIININSNEPTFYPYSIKVNKCSAAAIISMTHMQNYEFLMFLIT